MTALTHMAASARPPGITDARVPCPLCGGLIHPIAGKCKHCKQDLAQFRSGRQPAAAALPALGSIAAAPIAIASPASAPIPMASPTSGATSAPASAPIVTQLSREASQPILPPRPTGRSVAAQPMPSGSIWKSWPMVVIVLATVAIATAVVLMVWPPGTNEPKRNVGTPPAPERMPTDPLPRGGTNPPGSTDPWGQPHGSITPRPTPTPVQPDDPDPPDDTDVFGGAGGGGVLGGGTLGGGTLGRGTLGGTNLDFVSTAIVHACKRLANCPGVDQSMLSTTCDLMSQNAPQNPPVPRCDEARRCLQAIDNLSCDQSGFSNPTSVFISLQDCTAALSC